MPGTWTSASRPSMLRLRAHDADELSHYSAGTADVEFLYPWGWGELEGIAHRTDYDLKQHAEHSGQKLDYFDQASNERYVPYVIEPAAGVNRAMAAFLLAAYDRGRDRRRGAHAAAPAPAARPVQGGGAAAQQEGHAHAARPEVFASLSDRYMVDYDDTQSIGKRYRRQDEIGTPLCVTVDFDSLEDGAVTIRDRDTTEQVRVPIVELPSTIAAKLGF
jgi:glycyl-tRNA synthetase